TKYVKKLVNSGQLGEITKVTGIYDQDAFSDINIPITWRHINEISGSGSLGDLGSHLFSVLQYILGDLRAVNAMTSTVIKERPEKVDSNVMQSVENDDIAITMVEYQNGAIGTLSSSRIATGRKNRLYYEIQGTKGSVYYSLENLNEVNVYFENDKEEDRGFRKVLLGEKHEGYSSFQPASGISIGFNDFKILETHKVLESVVNDSEYTCDFDFGSRIDRIIEAILESAKSKTWVSI